MAEDAIYDTSAFEFLCLMVVYSLLNKVQ